MKIIMSSYKQKFNKKYGFDLNKSHSLLDISKITKIKKSILQEVYNRGVGAWKTNIDSVRLKSTGQKNVKAPRSLKMGKEQWAFARVYSFVMNGKTSKTADKDLFNKINI